MDAAQPRRCWMKERPPGRAINAINNPVAMINTAAETTMVDDGVGRLLAALDDGGLRENTLVIYTSDQGARYGHGGLWGNTSWSFPFTVHGVNMEIPLMFSQPGRVERGSGTRGTDQPGGYVFRPCSSTWSWGNWKFATRRARALAAMLTGDSPQWDDTAFFEFVTVRVVRTQRWKYMKRFDTEEPDTLFDLINDPDEKHNLIDEPAHAEVVTELDRRLTAFFSQYSAPQYDLWNGGSAKAILLDKHYGRNDVFRDRFPGWREPYTEAGGLPRSVIHERLPVSRTRFAAHNLHFAPMEQPGREGILPSFEGGTPSLPVCSLRVSAGAPAAKTLMEESDPPMKWPADRIVQSSEKSFGMYEEALPLMAQGIDVIHLEVGMPSFDTPAHIKEACKAALDSGMVHYGDFLGNEPFRRALAKKLASQNGIQAADVNEILVTSGLTHGAYISCMAALDPGDEVMLLSP